jgi:N-acetylglucosaminyl-diphospho-decaprenol L-rhamnosyltransferase
VRIRVVVVSHDAEAYLDRCLDALTATVWEGSIDIVVVDNASSDDSASVAERHGARVVRNATNVGFGAACNQAMTELDVVDAVALVNPDAFVTSGWLAPLADVLAADPGIGAACPKILFLDGRINNTGTFLDRRLNGRDRGWGDPDDGRWDVPGEVWGWCGAAVLLSTAYLREVGGFDERLFLYYEDIDLAWRGRERGWRYAYVPTSVVHHGRGWATEGHSELTAVQNRRNRLVNATKHAPWPTLVGVWVWCAASILGGALHDLVSGPRWMEARRRWRALRGAAALTPSLWRERRAEVRGTRR